MPPSCTRGSSALRTTGQSILYNNTTFSFQEYHKVKTSWVTLSLQETLSQWVSEAEALGLGKDKCSLSWLSLTDVTTVASVELLLIYIGLPSETHPVKCLGCIQATSGKVSLAGGKLKMVLWIVLSTGPSHLCPLRTEKPQGALNFCTDSPLPMQPCGSQGMAAGEAE